MNTHKFHLRLLLFAVMLSHWAVVKPEVVLPPLFADGMVLQRESNPEHGGTEIYRHGRRLRTLEHSDAQYEGGRTV